MTSVHFVRKNVKIKIEISFWKASKMIMCRVAPPRQSFLKRKAPINWARSKQIVIKRSERNCFVTSFFEVTRYSIGEAVWFSSVDINSTSTFDSSFPVTILFNLFKYLAGNLLLRRSRFVEYFRMADQRMICAAFTRCVRSRFFFFFFSTIRGNDTSRIFVSFRSRMSTYFCKFPSSNGRSF